MSNTPRANKRRGADFELRLVEWFRSRGYEAERLRLSGKDDEGDIRVQCWPGDPDVDVIEAKNVAKIDLASFVTQSEKEAENFRSKRSLSEKNVSGFAVIKRRGRPLGESYVVTTLDAMYPDLEN